MESINDELRELSLLEQIESDPGCGDGIQWYIDRNAIGLASGNINNGGSQAFSSGTGGAGLNTVAVTTGDKIYMIVHPKANISCDTTVVNLTISVTGAPTSTPTPTLTNTPTATFTPTATITLTPSMTPTSTATSAAITPTPRSIGSGTCWQSGPSWPTYSVSYMIDPSIPTPWINSIDIAANAWTNVTPSPFSFVNSSQSSYEISLGSVGDYYTPAYTWWSAPTGTTIVDIYTIFNDDRTFDTSNPASASSFNVRNIMMHEFGHWLDLEHVNATCLPAIMFGGVSTGEANKNLATADEDGINWQYP